MIRSFTRSLKSGQVENFLVNKFSQGEPKFCNKNMTNSENSREQKKIMTILGRLLKSNIVYERLKDPKSTLCTIIGALRHLVRHFCSRRNRLES